MSTDAVEARARAAVLGGLVADAATMPLHWIYDVPKINSLLADKGLAATPEFFPTPSCTFYAAPLGGQSPYGDELYPLLQSMAEAGGFSAEAYAQAMHDFYASHPDAYRNASVRAFLTNWDAGKRGVDCGHETDSQANCFAKVPLLVARYAGSPELLTHVEAAVRVQQNNPEAVRYGVAAARLLERVVLGSSVSDALAWAADASADGLPDDLRALAQRAVGHTTRPLTTLQFEPAAYMQDMISKHMALKDELPATTLAVWCNGPACGNPAAFTNVMLVAAATAGSSSTAPRSSSDSGYVACVRANMVAGGDNCSRSCLLAALLAAEEGMSAIPDDWRSRTTRYSEYVMFVDKLLAV